MASKIRGLQQWCARRTEGYRDVNVTDMSTSWRDGLAFCALIHRFRPDLIDFDSLSKENILENNQLAFEVAEKDLDIPAFLDAPDMVRMKKPDKLSIITYVSQYYNYFCNKPELGGPGVNKAGAKGSNSLKRLTSDDASAPNKRMTTSKEQNGIGSNKSKTGTLGDKCTICDGKVYLLERHVDNNKLYHRLCFRHSVMSPTNKVYNSANKDDPSSKVRKLDHVTNGDSKLGGKKSLFPETNGVSAVGNNTSVSKTPNKYHNLAMDFLAREAGLDNSLSGDKPKPILTSTPKSKYEDKTSLKVVSNSSQDINKSTNSNILDNKSKWSSGGSVQLTKSKNEPEKKSSQVVESKAREMTRLLEERSREPKIETPNSGLRDFLKKYHESGDKEKENKSVSNSSKNFEKMEVDPSSPVITKKQMHNSYITEKTEKSVTQKPWEVDRREANGAKSPFSQRKYLDASKDIGTKSVLNKSTQDTSVSSNSASNKLSDQRKYLDNSKDIGTKSVLSKSTQDTSVSSNSASNKLSDQRKYLDISKDIGSKSVLSKSTQDTSVSTSKASNKPSDQRKYLDISRDIGTKSVLSKSTQDTSLSTSSTSNILSDQNFSSSVLNSYKKNLEKHEKDMGVSRLKKDNDITINKPYEFKSKDKYQSGTGINTELSKISAKSEMDSEKSSIYPKKYETKPDVTKPKDNDTSNRYNKDSSYISSKQKTEPAKTALSPVPKPRGILKTNRHEEDMDTSETSNVKTSVNLRPSAAPRSVHNITKIEEKVKDERSKTPTRPKSPVRAKSPVRSKSPGRSKSPTRSKSPGRPLSPVVTKRQPINGTNTNKTARPQEAPPPLPVSPPPSTTTTSSAVTSKSKFTQPQSKVTTSKAKVSEDVPPLPRKSYLEKRKEETVPPLPPRSTLNIVSQDTHVLGRSEGPPKPPRLTIKEKKEDAMGIDEAVHKAMNPQTSPEAVAVLVSPSPTSNGSNVLGGLLKSLAGVRQKSPTENSPRDNRLAKSPENEPEVVLRRGGKDRTNPSAPVLNLLNKSNQERPKSVSGILDTSNNNSKYKPETPSWKTQLDKNKTDRPKSVSILDQLDDEVPSWKRNLEALRTDKARPKSVLDNSSNDDGKLTWQREAAKRMAKNKDFVDPEFEKTRHVKSSDDSKANINDVSKRDKVTTNVTESRRLPETPRSPYMGSKLPDKPVSPVDNREVPERPKTKSPETFINNGFRSVNQMEVDKKNHDNKYKVYPDISQPVNPSAPPLRKITPVVKFNFDNSFDSNNSTELNNRNKNNHTDKKLTPPRPPPLKVDISPRRYSHNEIRDNLINIDNKLTELELRGRQLEDTIRSATTSEGEDDLMNEWFKLINEKNELVRKEADFIYINKEQELEDEQDSIDSRLRFLISIPDCDKTQDERDEEDELINKKIDVINQRSGIIDSMDEDRIRYEEEDRDIAKVLQAKGYAKGDGREEPVETKINKKKKKNKK
ncbi:MICAL-like protein 2 isoform X2 [Patella vulgata]|uniref:MICAL-like protein 2 isoform X2 n=1 Tax=Patella vulgata TaxID=6465 RepID=UPI0024A7BDEC|nr:MICAL-like protein 2 isoform X2 [Patella vulgata]